MTFNSTHLKGCKIKRNASFNTDKICLKEYYSQAHERALDGPMNPLKLYTNYFMFVQNVHERDSIDFIMSPRGIEPTRDSVVQSCEYTREPELL